MTMSEARLPLASTPPPVLTDETTMERLGPERASYIDSVILRDRDANGGGGWAGASDGTLEERRYYCQNWRADVVAITKSDGTPLEYVRYSPYGEPTVYPAADIAMNGKVEAADYAEWNELINGYGTTAVYTPNITFDDSEDSLDDDLFAESYAANSGLSGKGRLSSPAVGNRIGYAGYQWDSASRLYQVRHRWYFPEIGRWGRRDPLGYVDGHSLYQYVMSNAVTRVDPYGLYGSANPVAIPAWLQVLVAQLTNQGLTAHQIMARLAAMGVSAWLIAEVMNVTTEKAFEVWLHAMVDSAGIYEALSIIYRMSATMLQKGGCKAADAAYHAFCKGSGAARSCDKVDAGKKCNAFKVEADRFMICAAARMAIITAGCPSGHDRMSAFTDQVKGAAKCYGKYFACLEAKNCPPSGPGGSGGGGSGGGGSGSGAGSGGTPEAPSSGSSIDVGLIDGNARSSPAGDGHTLYNGATVYR